MSNEIEQLRAITIPAFINMTSKEQDAFFMQLGNLNEDFRKKENFPLVKKFVALIVLATAREAAEDKSLFNLTAQFRNLLAFFGLDHLKLSADQGRTNNRVMYPGEQRSGILATNGYRLFHVSDMGCGIWTRKFFNIGIDGENNIITKKVRTQKMIGQEPETIAEDMKKWEVLNREDLSALMAVIQEETRYENTFGYDLLCTAMFCANELLVLNYLCATEASLACGLLLFPFVLALNLAIYAVTLPPALTSIAI
jgi:hypothetical protein